MRRMWLWPVVIGLLTAAGLVAGLISEGSGDYLAWIALALPVALACWFGLPPRQHK